MTTLRDDGFRSIWTQARLIGVRCARRGGGFVQACFWGDQDRWILWFPVALGTGIACYFALPWEPEFLYGVIALSIALSVLGLVFTQRPRWETRRPELSFVSVILGILILAVTLGMFAGQMRTRIVEAPVIEREIGPLELEGLIESAARQPQGSWLLIIAPQAIGDSQIEELPALVRVTVRQSLDGAAPGMHYRSRVILMPPPGPVAPGEFDFARQAWFDRIGAVGYSISQPNIEIATDSLSWHHTIQLTLRGFRQALAEHIRSQLPGAEGAVAAALLTGDRDAIPDDIVESLRASGLAHLLAISGLHMALVGGLVFISFRVLLALIPPIALKFPIKKWSAAAGLFGAFAYLLISGSSISTQRAFIMLLIVFVAVMLDRPAISMRNVAVAATIILLLTPESLLHVSFQMSFAAVVGLVSAYEWQRDRLDRSSRANWMWRDGFSPLRLLIVYLLGLVATTAIAELMIGPIAAFHFNRFTSFGIVANLAAVPLVGFLIMPMGLLALLLMPIGLEQLALTPMSWGIESVAWIAAIVSSWPVAEVATPSLPQAALLWIVCGVLWLILWRQAWRYAGVAFIVIGMGVAVSNKRPDVLIDREGANIAVRSSDGTLLALSDHEARFALSKWIESEGRSNGKDHTHARSQLYKCDELGCVTTDPELPLVAFVTDPRAFRDDCEHSDLIIAKVPLPRSLEHACRRHAIVVDRFDLWREGSHAVWFEKEGFRVESAAMRRGRRPWSVNPADRKRANP